MSLVQPIVDHFWLDEHIDQLVLCDVRTTMVGAEPYDEFIAGHLSGARFVLLDDDLAGQPPTGPAGQWAGVEGRHPLPTPEQFAATLGKLGIAHDDTVVAYDVRGGAIAARLVWMLRVIGQRAALLDGGLENDLTDHAIETGTTATELCVRRPISWPVNATASADDIVEHVAHGGIVIDSRDSSRYMGEQEPIDRIAGHIPGAINMPFTDNRANGRFLDRPALERRFSAIASDPNAIVYCGSGVTACHNALAIEHAGLPRPRVYIGSWSGWTSDPDRPIATGPT